jgi:hypothetical protein
VTNESLVHSEPADDHQCTKREVCMGTAEIINISEWYCGEIHRE